MSPDDRSPRKTTKHRSGATAVKTPATAPATGNAVERYFRISQRGSTVGREIRGGLVTFFTMAYIVVLNPLIIGTQADSTGGVLGGGAHPPPPLGGAPPPPGAGGVASPLGGGGHDPP